MMRETILEIQTRSMCNNLIFSCIPQHQCENPEALIKDLNKMQLKLSPDTINQITFHQVHGLGQRSGKTPRPSGILQTQGTLYNYRQRTERREIWT